MSEPTQAMHLMQALQQGAVLRWNLALSAGAIAMGWVLVSQRFAGSLALGALLETANFRALWRFSRRVLLAEGSASGAAAGAFGLRFVLLAGVLWVALGSGADPVGLVIGLSMIVPAVVIAAWQARPPPGPAGAVPPPDDASWDDYNPWLARERSPDDDEDAS